jgi:AcrR family transcriptional regulator
MHEETSVRRTTPLDAFHLARKKWLAGERLDVGKIAHELGIGRATVFRWVGTRESLYGEICSALFTKELDRAKSSAHGSGATRLVDVMERLLRSLATAAPLRRFVAEDPEFALRVLTSRASPVQARCTDSIRELFAELDLQTTLPADELAYIVVRITESFLYRDVLTGDAADIEAAIRALRILLSASVKKKKPKARAARPAA